MYWYMESQKKMLRRVWQSEEKKNFEMCPKHFCAGEFFQHLLWFQTYVQIENTTKPHKTARYSEIKYKVIAI